MFRKDSRIVNRQKINLSALVPVKTPTVGQFLRLCLRTDGRTKQYVLVQYNYYSNYYNSKI